MVTLKLTDDEFLSLCSYLLGGIGNKHKLSSAQYEAGIKSLVEKTKDYRDNFNGVSKKADTNKVWEALKGVVG